eukprot:g3124.t1
MAFSAGLKAGLKFKRLRAAKKADDADGSSSSSSSSSSGSSNKKGDGTGVFSPSFIEDKLRPLFLPDHRVLGDHERVLLLSVLNRFRLPSPFPTKVWTDEATSGLRLRTFAAGDMIYRRGDDCADCAVYLVLSGIVSASASRMQHGGGGGGGEDKTIAAGSAFGLREVQAGSLRQNQTTALSDVTCLTLDRGTFLGLLARRSGWGRGPQLLTLRRVLAKPPNNRAAVDGEALAGAIRHLRFFKTMQHDLLLGLCAKALRLDIQTRPGHWIFEPGEPTHKTEDKVYVVVTGSVGLYRPKSAAALAGARRPSTLAIGETPEEARSSELATILRFVKQLGNNAA